MASLGAGAGQYVRLLGKGAAYAAWCPPSSAPPGQPGLGCLVGHHHQQDDPAALAKDTLVVIPVVVFEGRCLGIAQRRHAP